MDQFDALPGDPDRAVELAKTGRLVRGLTGDAIVPVGAPESGVFGAVRGRFLVLAFGKEAIEKLGGGGLTDAIRISYLSKHGS